MGNFKVYTTFNKGLGQTAPCTWKCLKTQFWGPLTNWKFELPTHTLTSSSINTQNRSKNYVWIYHGMHWTLSYRQKLTLYHTEKQGFGYPWLSKQNSRHTHQYPLKPSPVSERSAYPLQNYICFSPLTSGLESFGHKSTPSDRPWIEAYCPKF